MRKYASAAQVAERYGVDTSTVWRWVQKQILPAPLRISDNCTRFDLDKLEQLDAERETVEGPSERVVRATAASLNSPKRAKRQAVA